MYRRILLALDGSRCARRALDEAIDVAAAAGAVVEAVSVVAPAMKLADVDSGFIDERELDTASHAEAEMALEEARLQFARRGVTGGVRMIDSHGASVSDVLALAAEASDADLIVMGTHGRRGVKRLLLGSVAEAVARSASRPVLLVHAPASQS
jgi:nucleotide-binding universal stress UspA family protein